MTLQQPAQQPSNFDEEVRNGFYRIIKLFDSGILYFPRTISTRNLNDKQVEVVSKNEALFYFRQSNYIDCRINAFRSTKFGEKWYPDLLFIDIDRSDFKTEKGFKLALTTTLRNIRDRLNSVPMVLWSGYGFHIYQPIKGIVFENYEIFSEFINEFDLFKEFLRYSKTCLSNNKSDPGFNPSLGSCLLRIPGSLNGKFLDNRDKRLSGNFKVKILQEWNGVRAKVSDDFLADFRIHLIDRKIKEIKENNTNNNNQHQKYYNNNNSIDWIEKLLQTPIHDFRKLAIWRILCPYLINIKRLSPNEATVIMRDWLQKCNSNSGRKLDFNPEDKIKDDLKYVGDYKPLAFNKFKTEPEFSELYQILKDKGAL